MRPARPRARSPSRRARSNSTVSSASPTPSSSGRIRSPAVNLWARGKRKARISFEEIGAAFTPYPSLRIFPQDEHEQLLVDRLAGMGVEVERRTELVGFSDGGDRVVARLRRAERGEEACEAAFIAGCDGASSLVRQTLGVGFPGGTYEQVFYVADVEASGPPVDGELHVDLDEADFLAFFPLAGEGGPAWSERCGANAPSAPKRCGSRT